MPGTSTASAAIAARSSSSIAAATHACRSPVSLPLTSGSERADDSARSTRGRERTIVLHREPVGAPVRDEHHARRAPNRVSQSSSSRVERKLLAHVLFALRAQRIGADGVGEQIDGALRALLDRVDQVAVVALADLELDPAGTPADHGPSLPEPLAHGEAEAFPQRLLEHHVGDRAGTR